MATIRKRKKRYQVQIRVKNHSSTKTFASMQSARLWANFEENRILKESNPQYRYKPFNLAEVLVQYQQLVLNKRENNSSDKWFVKAFLRLAWVQKTLNHLSALDIATYRDQRLKDIKASSLHRQFFVLKHALNTADREWGWDVPKELLNRIRIPMKPLKKIRRISLERQTKLLSTCLKMGRADMHLIIMIALRTALRRSEILSLNWKDIDFEENLITVNKTKNGHYRVVPIGKDLYELLSKAQVVEGGKLFTLTPNAVRLAFERIRRKAEMNEVRFHDLRHEAISSFFEMGLTVPEVALVSGHRTLSMLMRYSHGQLNRICSIINNH